MAGIELPRTPKVPFIPVSLRNPRTDWKVAAYPGFEPGLKVSETSVLPLHQQAICENRNVLTTIFRSEEVGQVAEIRTRIPRVTV
jgi:hypothetical protein